MWFRRDLRLRDHPALRRAAEDGDVLGLFVLDPVLWRGAGAARRAWLAASLRSLDESMGGRLCVRLGEPASAPRAVSWLEVEDDREVAGMLEEAVGAAPDGMPAPGEDAARRRLHSFLDRDLEAYDDLRDRPGDDRTSRLSAYLKYGVLHP